VLVQVSSWQSAVAQTRSGGFMPNAVMIAATSMFHQHLEYTDDEQMALQDLGLLLLRDEITREVRQQQRQFAIGDLESHFKNHLVGHKEEATEFNSTILKPVEDLLGAPGRIRRFRQLMTQRLMWAGDLDAVIRYNELDVNFDQYRKMVEHYREQKAKIPPVESLQYRAALTLLRQVIALNDLEQLVGEEFLGEMAAQKGGANPLSAADDRLTLLRRIGIYEELGLSVGQAKELVPLLKSLMDDTRVTANILAGAVALNDEVEYDKQKKGFRKDVRSSLGKVLDEEQLKRLEQLEFQLRIRSLALKEALSAAGFGAESEKLPDNTSNWIQVEAHHAQQIMGFNAGFRAVASGIGFEAAAKLCGKPEIERDATRYLYPEEHDLIMDSVKKRIPFATDTPGGPGEGGINPRRR
jgi:hypothetical protein